MHRKTVWKVFLFCFFLSIYSFVIQKCSIVAQQTHLRFVSDTEHISLCLHKISHAWNADMFDKMTLQSKNQPTSITKRRRSTKISASWWFILRMRGKLHAGSVSDCIRTMTTDNHNMLRQWHTNRSSTKKNPKKLSLNLPVCDFGPQVMRSELRDQHAKCTHTHTSM